MPHPNEETVRRAYAAINARDVQGFMDEFTQDAVWHGSGTEIRGREALGGLVGGLVEASEGTLHIELHDVLANDEHVAVLQITRAERKGRRLADRVIYVFHLDRGKITEAWFNGDPRVQDEFWAD
jgi:ketosteroid isomerase-like protein